MPAEFDLNSLIELQKDYAQDLDAIDKGGESNYVKKLNTELNDLHNTLQNSNVSTESILLKQKGVNNLLDSEISRLDAKKANIEDAITGQKRLSNFIDLIQKNILQSTELSYLLFLQQLYI